MATHTTRQVVRIIIQKKSDIGSVLNLYSAKPVVDVLTPDGDPIAMNTTRACVNTLFEVAANSDGYALEALILDGLAAFSIIRKHEYEITD